MQMICNGMAYNLNENTGDCYILTGIKYKCVTAIILRKNKNKLITQAELLDVSGHSRSIADIKRIERVNND